MLIAPGRPLERRATSCSSRASSVGHDDRPHPDNQGSGAASEGFEPPLRCKVEKVAHRSRSRSPTVCSSKLASRAEDDVDNHGGKGCKRKFRVNFVILKTTKPEKLIELGEQLLEGIEYGDSESMFEGK